MMDELHKLQVQAYVAEYQAMMTRMTWFMSMQFVLSPPSVAALLSSIAAGNHKLIPFLWVAIPVFQFTPLIYYFALHEVYNHALYIETILKPKIGTLLHLDTGSFWGWEKHLKKYGKAHNPLFGDLVPAALSGIGYVVTTIIAVTGTQTFWWNCLVIVITGTLWVGASVLGNRVVKARKDLETAISNTILPNYLVPTRCVGT
jgi:hypothetical protein